MAGPFILEKIVIEDSNRDDYDFKVTLEQKKSNQQWCKVAYLYRCVDNKRTWRLSYLHQATG